MIGHEETEVLTAVQAVPAAPASTARGGQFFAHPWVAGVLFLLIDVLSLALANAAASALVNVVFHMPQAAINPLAYWRYFLPSCVIVLYFLNGYASVDLRRPERELELAFKALSFSFLVLLAASALSSKTLPFPPYFVLAWFLFPLVLVICGRWLVRSFYAHLWKNGSARTRALVIGDPDDALRYQQLLTLQRHQAYEIVGFISYNGDLHCNSPSLELQVLGSIDDWEEIAQRHNAQVIVFNLPATRAERSTVVRGITECRASKFHVELFTDLLNTPELSHQFDDFSGCFRISSRCQWSRTLQSFCKCGLDLVCGVVGALITLLITPIVAVLINLEDRGPVFHRREFVGCDGSTKHYLKFRTMVRNADEILRNDPELRAQFQDNYKLREDPRILRVGRFLRKYSIDEFPQFFSLLRGQLTLVGPRVIAREEKIRYGDLLVKRLSVKPGMTGYWQVMGRQNTTYDERIQMDMFYIDHWSIWLDLLIVIKTFGKLIRPEGAY